MKQQDMKMIYRKVTLNGNTIRSIMQTAGDAISELTINVKEVLEVWKEQFDKVLDSVVRPDGSILDVLNEQGSLQGRMCGD